MTALISLDDACDSFLAKLHDASLSYICVLQGAVATGAAEGHRGSDEEATGKPKKG